MNKAKEPEYPVELESQFILRLPEEPAKVLREALRSEENLKNRLTIQLQDDMRHGEVRFDHWLLHGKIVDLPTIIESHKTIDRKSLYKTADICQMMICKHEMDPTSTEEESPTKNKRKDPFKVDKKFLFPHGVTPPSKNVRKRRFRKTLKKKSLEAPEIEKEVKRLLRADNEAVSVTFEVIQEEVENDHKPEPSTPAKSERTPAKVKKELQNIKHEAKTANQPPSKVEDIFGDALSDSDLEEEQINVDLEGNRMQYDDHMSDSNSMQGIGDFRGSSFATQFRDEMFHSSQMMSMTESSTANEMSRQIDDYLTQPSMSSSNSNPRLQQLAEELQELKQRKQRTMQEISGMENMALKQRFLDIIHKLNQDIMYKELEYQGLQSQLSGM